MTARPAITAEVVRVLDELEGGEHARLHLPGPRCRRTDRVGRRHGGPRSPGSPAAAPRWEPWGPVIGRMNPLRDQLVPMCHMGQLSGRTVAQCHAVRASLAP